MARQGARLRQYTFFARLPRGVTNVDLVKLLVQRFTKSEFSGVQDFSAGRFEVVFKTKDADDRFLADPAVELRGEQVRFEYRGSRVKIVRVFNYPLEEQDVDLRRVLGGYGSVHAMQRETIAGFTDFLSGTMRVRMDMVRPVPNPVKILDRYVAHFEYEGVVHQCVRCGGTGHYAAACATPKCSCCEQFGHESCEPPCPQCQGNHARYECHVRSFAAAVAGRAATSVAETLCRTRRSAPTPKCERRGRNQSAEGDDDTIVILSPLEDENSSSGIETTRKKDLEVDHEFLLKGMKHEVEMQRREHAIETRWLALEESRLEWDKQRTLLEQQARYEERRRQLEREEEERRARAEERRTYAAEQQGRP
ncbi:hypothetical protein HPB48_009598 [Haemaphysalis longicornis]|uniref:CCHC-type domain-containing protein n=1 Tax=Haemaphysalis longicornis TaxID=44386 RepID=A0A9J6FUH0_HAELO|nr:hypothetical protein HPB48_009598 [Haemaphysalis longicornis]